MANSIVDTVVGPIAGLRDWYEGRQVERYIPGEDVWLPAIQRTPMLKGFNGLELQRLRELVGEFLYQKRFIAADSMALNDRIELGIATQACIPLLGLSLDWYRGWNTITVHPCRIVARQHAAIDDQGAGLEGETLPDEGVALCWDDSHRVDDSSNGPVVIQVFANKLDGLDNMMMARPPLHHNMDHDGWLRIWKQSFEDAKGNADLGGATTLAEFFAVCSERFFVHPMELWQDYPQNYQQLRIFYHQDPLARVSEVAH